MRQVLFPVATLLLSVALLVTGHGMQLTLLPLRAAELGWSDTAISITAAGYFAGFILGCLGTPLLVRRVGHIRAFAVLASGASAIILLHGMLPSVVLWTILRLGTGFCLSGLYMVAESWLSEQSTASTRGTLLSVYTTINLTVMLAGQMLLNLVPLDSALPFLLASVFLSLAVMPVALTAGLQPQPLHRVRFPFRMLLAKARTALVGAAVAGLANGGFWALAPVFTRDAGLDTLQTTLFMSATILGGAVAQLPLGRLSDHHDRRWVILLVLILGCCASIALALMHNSGATVLQALGFCWGASAMTIYALCVAHANDYAGPDEFVAVGGGVLMTYSLGSVAGPLLVPALLPLTGSSAVYWTSATALGLGALYLLIRVLRVSRDLPDDQAPFVAVPEATQEALSMDPRADEDDVSDEVPGSDKP